MDWFQPAAECSLKQMLRFKQGVKRHELISVQIKPEKQSLQGYSCKILCFQAPSGNTLVRSKTAVSLVVPSTSTAAAKHGSNGMMVAQHGSSSSSA